MHVFVPLAAEGNNETFAIKCLLKNTWFQKIELLAVVCDQKAVSCIWGKGMLHAVHKSFSLRLESQKSEEMISMLLTIFNSKSYPSLGTPQMTGKAQYMHVHQYSIRRDLFLELFSGLIL